jgi:hypothetical protein
MLQLTICGVTHVPSPQFWVVCEVSVQVLFSIVNDNVLNQNHGHWLFMGALQFQILTCQDIQEKLAFQIIPNNLANNDIFDHELKELNILLMQKIVNVHYTRRNPPKCN